MKKRAIPLTVVAFAAYVSAAMVAAPAAAHGGLQQSKPEADARVSKAPGRVTMTFSEVPSGDSVMKVVDGCKRDVVQATSTAGNDLVGDLGSGQPGKWKASYRVISAEDGHLTKGTYSFTVGGTRDCSPNDGENGSDEETESPGPGDPPSATDEDDDGGSFPVVPVAVGAAGLLIVGLVARRASGS